ncbi:signal transduction histidine kinase [Arthrobacter pascens]|uniref:sensor histidine kinase n=1 Tax=Arthrobacter pascens TaxID=1677 RepID=UPI0027804043|nr:HAMP domain-containing sensor histidine kinase [Arthrobacter pascens]MDQ0632397.1 signal transduction histidine kinase [Arthrobacter pascens]
MRDGEPFFLLASRKAIERLRGARMLMELDSAPSMSRLRQLRSTEPDSWVKAALDRAISKWESAGNPSYEESWISIPALELEDIKAEAIQSVTQVILHEIKPLIADIHGAAKNAIGTEYTGSIISRRIERLKDLLVTIRRLNEASTPPDWMEFDLVDLVVEVISDSGFTRNQAVASRVDTVSAKGDRGLIRLALENALRNAVEASENTKKTVIVNCGANELQAWISVLDEGIGLPDARENLYEPGVTKKSKDAHFGWGLTIAKRAIKSLDGSINLISRESGGTSCEIRWPLPTPSEGKYEDSPG